MDIKLKNKYLHKIALVVIAYLIGLSVMLTIDILTHTEYLGNKPYFSSYEFKNELSTLFYNIKSYHIDYKDYTIKSNNDKIAENELEDIKNRYEPELKEKQTEIETMYKNYIDAANKLGDKDKATLLIEERDKKLEEAKKENGAKIDIAVKEAVKLHDKNYFSLGKSLSQNRDIKYYIKNAHTGETYSNLSSVANIETYIKDKALYSIQFPNEDDRNSYFSSINSDFRNYGLSGYFIILQEINGYNQMHANYTYYNSIGQRITHEILILVISLVVLLAIIMYLRKNTNEYVKYLEKYIDKSLDILRKVPLDVRLFIFLIISLTAIAYESSTAFFYKPISISHIFKISFITIINLYILVSLIDIVELIRNKDEGKVHFRKSLTYRIYSFIIESLSHKTIMSKILLFSTLTGLFCMCLLLLPASLSSNDDGILVVSSGYIFMYILVVPYYVIKKIISLSKIIEGSEQIASGNFNHSINVKDKGNLSKLAYNINNLQNSFKNSLESQMKSEKMKSELITNVSHDLKTPLTSIINYVDLLKREDLSEEEIKDYIGVLDRKTQRLKVLIEDLFEASKVASGAVDLNIERVDVAALLHQTLGEFDEKIKSSSLTFKVNAAKQKIYASLDGKKTWRVFENLINNALKYSQPNTRVYIDLTEEENKVILTIKNISSYEMDFDVEEIFERFKRGDKSRNTEGSGLGLAIAKSIVELQGGKLTIEVDGDLFKAIVEFFK